MAKTKIGIDPSQYSGPIGSAMKQVSRETVKEVLMRRDKMSESDADDLIQEFKDELDAVMGAPDFSFNKPEELMADYFGLEPDYLDEFLY